LQTRLWTEEGAPQVKRKLQIDPLGLHELDFETEETLNSFVFDQIKGKKILKIIKNTKR